jgi:hypothetical protein
MVPAPFWHVATAGISAAWISMAMFYSVTIA